MNLKFNYIPLTFLTDEEQIKYQIKNTIILRYLFDKFKTTSKLESLIEDTQYGYNASALKSGKNKFLRISDITDGKVDWESVPFCDCTDQDTYLLNTEDLLVARTGGTTGKSFLISNPPEDSVFAGYLIRMRANKQNNPKFINLFLNSYIYWSQIVSLNKGDFRPSVNATKLKNLILPKVDIAIQNEVVNISNGQQVDSFDELYNQIEEAISKYSKSKRIIDEVNEQFAFSTDLKKSILQDAIQGKITKVWRKQNLNTAPASELLERMIVEKEKLIKNKKIRKERPFPTITQEQKPFEIPENWTWCRIGDISENKTGNSINKQLKESKYTAINDGLAYIGTKDVPFSMGSINYDTGVKIPIKETENKFKIAEKKSVFICIEGGSSGKKIGFIEKNVCYGNKLLACTPYVKEISKYFYYLFYSKHFQNEFKEQSKGLRSGVSVNSFKHIKIPVPPFDELIEIVRKIEILMQKCNELELEITQSKQHANRLMQAVLKEAFEGKKEEIVIEYF